MVRNSLSFPFLDTLFSFCRIKDAHFPYSSSANFHACTWRVPSRSGSVRLSSETTIFSSLDKSEVDRRVCDTSCLIDNLSGIRKQVDAFDVMKNMLIISHNGNPLLYLLNSTHVWKIVRSLQICWRESFHLDTRSRTGRNHIGCIS